MPRTHVDDEYAFAGEADPKVLVTTSRDPSSRLTQFAKVRESPACCSPSQPPEQQQQQQEASHAHCPHGACARVHCRLLRHCSHAHALQEVKLVIPNAQRINRGGMVLAELVNTCRSHDFTDIVVLHEHRGEPGERAGLRLVSTAWVALQRLQGPPCSCLQGPHPAARPQPRAPVSWLAHARIGCCAPADGMVVTHLPYGPTAYFGIYSTVLRHDIGQKKEVRVWGWGVRPGSGRRPEGPLVRSQAQKGLRRRPCVSRMPTTHQ